MILTVYLGLDIKIESEVILMFNGEKVTLRALEMNDLDKILKYWNNWDLRRSLLTNLPISKISEEEWLRKAVKDDPFRDGAIHLAIEDKLTSEYMGNVGLFNIDLKSKRAEFGIAIMNREHFNKGFGTDATKVLLWVGFHVLNLHSIYLRVINFNERGIQAYIKAGFKHAGVFREASYAEGSYHDMIVMDILKKDFFEKFPPGSFVLKN